MYIFKCVLAFCFQTAGASWHLLIYIVTHASRFTGLCVQHLSRCSYEEQIPVAAFLVFSKKNLEEVINSNIFWICNHGFLNGNCKEYSNILQQTPRTSSQK